VLAGRSLRLYLGTRAPEVYWQNTRIRGAPCRWKSVSAHWPQLYCDGHCLPQLLESVCFAHHTPGGHCASSIDGH
jgi:hypothetical protein